MRILTVATRRLNIVVVGANDGKTNDPVYGFAMDRPDATSVLLIEPNEPLLPYLRANYSSHPSHQIANCAIGEEGTLILYAVKQEQWERFQPAYARGWPPYRAATGITSAVKSHLEEALARENLDPESAIDLLEVPAKELKTLLMELMWPAPIDVLQVDAEGCDDEVIYSCNLSYTRPKLILFENSWMPRERGKSLEEYLSRQRYRTYRMGGDSLAVDTRTDLTCITLNSLMIMFSGVQSVVLAARRAAVVAKSLARRHERDTCDRKDR